MTKLTLQQLKNHKGHKTVKKLYFKKYPYCLRYGSYMSYPYISRWDPNRDKLIIEHEKKHKKLTSKTDQIMKDLKTLKKIYSIRSRHECGTVSIFLETEKDFLDFANIFETHSDILSSIETPVSDTQVDLMKNDMILEIRDKLIYGKYRYKLESYRRRYTDDDIDQWIELGKMVKESFDPTDYKLNSNLTFIMDNPASYVKNRKSWIGAFTVYFKNYNDVCSIKFIYNDMIKKMTKIALLDEVEDGNGE